LNKLARSTERIVFEARNELAGSLMNKT